MKIVSKDEEKMTVELTNAEAGLIALIGVEFTQGMNSPSDEEWEALIPVDRESTAKLLATFAD